VGVSKDTVEHWRQEESNGVIRQRKKLDPRVCLSAKQIRKLERELKRGTYANGYDKDYWTLDRITHVIWTLFKVHYHPSGV
jgi:transposase